MLNDPHNEGAFPPGATPEQIEQWSKSMREPPKLHSVPEPANGFTNEPNPNADRLVIPAAFMPDYRTQVALHRGTQNNLLLKTWGGLGDQICAEPTLRYALEQFKDCSLSLASEQPTLFEHLKFERTFDLKREQPIWEKYFEFNTIVPPSHIVWQFMSHMLVNCVDFPSLCAFRSQLPVAARPVKIPVAIEEIPASVCNQLEGFWPLVCVHPGAHWPSKTFPREWWNAVLTALVAQGIKPVIIGAKADENRTTVEVNTEGCIDLRDQMTIRQSIGLLQRSAALITNDSSPLHMAVTGDAWISFIATVKHPDFITHWRMDERNRPHWSWRMKNYGVGGLWEKAYSILPNNSEEITCEHVNQADLESWLPEPTSLVTDTLAQARAVYFQRLQ